MLSPSKLILIFLLISVAAKAQNATDSQDWIIRNQQDKIEEERRIREMETIKKDHERIKQEEKKEEETEVFGRTKKCLPINKIRLLGAESISKYRQKNLVSDFIGKCLDQKILAEIIAKVKKYYHDSGYVTTQVTLPKQNLESGILELQIIEGKIEKISYGKDGISEKMQKFTAFGDIEGKTLDVGEINQGIYQMNRLSSNQATMKIEPGSQIGQSKVLIENKKKFPAQFTIGKDNLGNKFTGVQRTNLSSNFDNIFSLNDNIGLSYTTNTHENNTYKDLKSFSANLSIPFQSNTFSYSFYRSEFKGSNQGETELLVTKGFSQQSKFAFDRVLFGKNNLKITANSSLTNKSTASYQNGSKLSNSERELTILNLGFSASSFFANKTSLYFKPTYAKGLKALNATKDEQTGFAQKAQFEALKIYASASKQFLIPKINKTLTLSTEMDSQISKHTLYGSEQFAVGGYYSVRGFRENYISADSGYYFRNKISFSPGYKLTFEPFFDYGYATYRNTNIGASGRLSGGGLKTIFYHKYFNASLTYAKVLGKSKLSLVSSNEKENQMVYFELSVNCC